MTWPPPNPNNNEESGHKARPPNALIGACATATDCNVLYGAGEIATFLFGDPKYRRRVYNLVNGNELPIFRVGVNICARKTVLLEWIAAQERTNRRKD
jgi:hypothetical protein